MPPKIRLSPTNVCTPNGRYRTALQFLEFFRKQEGMAKGRRMISARDLIWAPDYASESAVRDLRHCFDHRSVPMVTNTSIHHSPASNLAGIVAHNHGTENATEFLLSLERIPHYESMPLSGVAADPRGAELIGALAGDRLANMDRVMKNLSELLFYSPDRIRVTTVDPEIRKQGDKLFGDYVYFERNNGYSSIVCGQTIPDYMPVCFTRAVELRQD